MIAFVNAVSCLHLQNIKRGISVADNLAALDQWPISENFVKGVLVAVSASIKLFSGCDEITYNRSGCRASLQRFVRRNGLFPWTPPQQLRCGWLSVPRVAVTKTKIVHKIPLDVLGNQIKSQVVLWVATNGLKRMIIFSVEEKRKF